MLGPSAADLGIKYLLGAEADLEGLRCFEPNKLALNAYDLEELRDCQFRRFTICEFYMCNTKSTVRTGSALIL